MAAFRGGVDSPEAEQARELARLGRLAHHYGVAPPRAQLTIRRGVHEIACQVVFQRISLPVERARHHHDCALDIRRMRPDCLDRFHDAVEALLADTLRRATIPILNLDAWMASRVTPVTIDDHRSRRGARGAQQRPNVPHWLRQELGHDPWLVDLALAILTWVGIPDTAGTDLWPLDAWADRRAGSTGDYITSNPTTVRREIELVLAAMRHRPGWYARYVERPLDHKPIAVTPAMRTRDGGFLEPPPLPLVDAVEQHDAALYDLAARCLEAIRLGLERPGADRYSVVADAVRVTFLGVPTEFGYSPYDDDADVAAIVADPDAVARIVATVLDIFADTDIPDDPTDSHRRPAG